MKNWVLPALASLVCACTTLPAPDVVQGTRWRGPIPSNSLDLATFGIGNCQSDGGSVDLTRMMVLESQRVDLPGEQRRPFRVTLQGEAVYFETLDDERETWAFNIGRIAGRTEDLDVDLKFVLVENQIAVYWRETFQHRTYRQGLLRIAGEQLVRWCEGTGGVNSRSDIERTTLE